MSELQLKPEWENQPEIEDLHGGSGAGGGAQTVEFASAGRSRNARRRTPARRLRPLSDDGFRLFRVY